jgi:cytochrome c biogenesis protein CcdA
MLQNRVVLFFIFVVIFSSLILPVTDIVPVSSAKTDHSVEAKVTRVVVYLTYSCPFCSSDAWSALFEQYYDELWASLKQVGIRLRSINSEPELDRDLARLYQELEVPETMRIMYTLVVSVDEKFLFISLVPVPIITDFLANCSKDYDKIAVLRNEVRDSYMVMDGQGRTFEYKMNLSFRDRLPYSHLANPWPIVSLLLVSGLLDGINPCAFAVIIFFISLQFATGSVNFLEKTRRKVMLLGSTYIAAVYLTYLTIGVTLKQTIQIIPCPHMVSRIGMTVLILAGIVHIKDYFWPGGRVSLRISPSHWRITREWMRRCTLPATFVAGMLVALFEFPCTGGVYVAILGVLAARTAFVEGLAYLLLYNVAFIFPLVLILVVSLVRPVRWQRHHGKYMKLLDGVIYIALGLLLIAVGV